MTQHSIEAKTLPELKQLALNELGLTRNEVRQHGDLRQRSTWIEAVRAALNAGKTTQEYQDLPLVQGIELQCNVTHSEGLQDNDPSEKRIELSAVPWLHNPTALKKIEASIDWKHHCNLLVKPSELKWLRRKEASFCCYEDWMHPGKFVDVYPIGLCQVLFLDLHGIIYYIAFKDNQIHRQYLSSFLEKAQSVPHTHQGAVEYLNKLYLNLSMGGITTVIV